MAENSGKFKKGWTGNPGGRRKDPEKFASFRAFLRTYEQEAAQELVERSLGRTKEDGTRDRATADGRMLELMLAYMHGKPQQSVKVDADINVNDLPDATLDAALRSELAAIIGAAVAGEVSEEPTGLTH